tara:strand:- start:255 stop:455 length:201 start_codon:yes stop_codon:yes gene_type:complete
MKTMREASTIHPTQKEEKDIIHKTEVKPIPKVSVKPFRLYDLASKALTSRSRGEKGFCGPFPFVKA